MDEQQKSHMNDKIHNLRSTFDAHLSTKEEHEKMLVELLRRKGKDLDVDFGARLQVERIEKSIKDLENEIKITRLELARHENALARDEYIK